MTACCAWPSELAPFSMAMVENLRYGTGGWELLHSLLQLGSDINISMLQQGAP